MGRADRPRVPALIGQGTDVLCTVSNVHQWTYHIYMARVCLLGSGRHRNQTTCRKIWARLLMMTPMCRYGRWKVDRHFLLLCLCVCAFLRFSAASIIILDKRKAKSRLIRMIVNETVIVGTRFINRFRDKARATHKNSQRMYVQKWTQYKNVFCFCFFLTHDFCVTKWATQRLQYASRAFFVLSDKRTKTETLSFPRNRVTETITERTHTYITATSLDGNLNSTLPARRGGKKKRERKKERKKEKKSQNDEMKSWR